MPKSCTRLAQIWLCLFKDQRLKRPKTENLHPLSLSVTHHRVCIVQIANYSLWLG